MEKNNKEKFAIWKKKSYFGKYIKGKITKFLFNEKNSFIVFLN